MVLFVARSLRFRDHDPGPFHPERPGRLAAIERALDAAPLTFETIPPRPATDEELLAFHRPEYLERLAAVRGRAVPLDPDTPTSADSVDVAREAAGAAVDLLSRVASGRGDAGLGLLRPPGHHALPDRAMGFCLLGNVAIAVKRLLDVGAVGRVAIYDWDVHHGNGTQAAFYDDPRVLFLSTHRWPFYPGTGRREDVGAGRGHGSTQNFPVPAGTSGATLLEITDEHLAPAVRDFGPDLIVISAGYDAHEDDPLGGLEVTTEDFGALAERWRAIAEETCAGRIAGLLEGGYDDDALAASVLATAEAWS